MFTIPGPQIAHCRPQRCELRFWGIVPVSFLRLWEVRNFIGIQSDSLASTMQAQMSSSCSRALEGICGYRFKMLLSFFPAIVPIVFGYRFWCTYRFTICPTMSADRLLAIGAFNKILLCGNFAFRPYRNHTKIHKK